jgi:hypothetical protein
MNEALVAPFIITLTTYGKRRSSGKRISIFREQLQRILPSAIVEEIYDYYFPIDPKSLNQASPEIVRSALVVACLYKNIDVFKHILWTDEVRKKLYDSKPLVDSSKYSIIPAHNTFMEKFAGYGYFYKKKAFIQAVFNMTCFTENERMIFAFPPAEVDYSEGLYCIAEAGKHKLVSKIIQVVGCQNINVQILMSGACAGKNKPLVKLANHYGGFITKKHIDLVRMNITSSNSDFVQFLEALRHKHTLLHDQWHI